jgi:hypothetical protein
MRIGLLTSMMIALPLAEVFEGMLPGFFANGSRMVLITGGFTIFVSGAVTLWIQRVMLRDMIRFSDRPEMEAATHAFRSYRKSARGADPDETEEIEHIEEEGPDTALPSSEAMDEEAP